MDVVPQTVIYVAPFDYYLFIAMLKFIMKKLNSFASAKIWLKNIFYLNLTKWDNKVGLKMHEVFKDYENNLLNIQWATKGYGNEIFNFLF